LRSLLHQQLRRAPCFYKPAGAVLLRKLPLAKRQHRATCILETLTAWEGGMRKAVSAKQQLLFVMTIELLAWLLAGWGAVSFML
jgi:hypothetical protein